MEAASAPQRSDAVPPPFLQLQQHDSWRRAVAALDAWRGALLLEPVGSGKTWIALGVAAGERRPAVVVVPSILRDQWTHAAACAGVPIETWTHERLSRGALPRGNPSLVVIDEAHRFRDPATRRLRTIAPWLVGRRVLLLTGTPIVNRLGDLVSLLRLALPDNALALDGIERLSDLEEFEHPPTALRRVAIRSPRHVSAAVPRRGTFLEPDAAESRRGAVAVSGIGQLELSECAATRGLIASVLLDAAASSDAALRRALRRYLALLLHSRDAGGVSRAMLRQFAGESLEQLVLWPMVATGNGLGDLPRADIARVELLLATTPDDAPWMARLASHCSDDRPTICFTRHRETARLLRTELGDDTAWITGTAAGIGPHRLARGAILDAFGTRRAEWRLRRRTPQLLVATDVAAEGLDLQGAGRIVHVDLPWTATRLEQREGRLARLGQQHAHVEVVVRLPAPAIERAFAPDARVRRKRTLAEEWLSSLEGAGPPIASVAGESVYAVAADGDGSADHGLVQLRRDRQTGAILMTRSDGGEWCVEKAGTASTRNRVLGARPGVHARAANPQQVLVAAARAAVIKCQRRDVASSAMVSRIHRLARVAAARRDGDALRRLDRLLRFASASGTAGMRAIIEQLHELSDRDFLKREVPDVRAEAPIEVSAIAAILFRSPAPALRCTDVPLPDDSL